MDGRPGALHAGRDEGLPEVEHLAAGDVAQGPPSAEGLEAEEGHQARADDEDEGLQGLGVGDGLEPAHDRVQAGDDDDQDGADPEAVQAEPVELGQQDAEDDAAGEDADGQLGQDVGHEGDDRQDRPGRRREAPLQELGHGEDPRAHVERHHDPAQDEQAPGVQFIVGHGHAVGRARTGQADEVFGPDVRGEDGGPDDEPAEVAAGQEVLVGGVLLLAHDLPGQAQDDPEIGGDDDPVEGFQHAHVRSLGAGCAAGADFTSPRSFHERTIVGTPSSRLSSGYRPLPPPTGSGLLEADLRITAERSRPGFWEISGKIALKRSPSAAPLCRFGPALMVASGTPLPAGPPSLTGALGRHPSPPRDGVIDNCSIGQSSSSATRVTAQAG